MRCDSQASLSAHTFANHYIGQKPKVKVTTISHNDGKCVVNYIMGPHVFIAMGAM
jgi:hypothetical protein